MRSAGGDSSARFDAGVARVVIGTRAAESLDFRPRNGRRRLAANASPSASMRADGLVSTKGWTEKSALPALDLARRAEDAGAGTIIYTDIATDGMLQGPNFAELEKMLGALALPAHRQRRRLNGGGCGAAPRHAGLVRLHHRQGAV